MCPNNKDIENDPLIIKMRDDSLKGMMEARGLVFENNFASNKTNYTIDHTSDNSNITKSLTLNALQKNWYTPTEFPLCPSDINENPLNLYAENLIQGKIFSRNKHTVHFVDEFKLLDNKLIIRTHANEGIKRHSLINVTFENGAYIHEGTLFFEEIGAKKYFILEQGLEWYGDDVFDDFC